MRNHFSLRSTYVQSKQAETTKKAGPTHIQDALVLPDRVAYSQNPFQFPFLKAKPLLLPSCLPSPEGRTLSCTSPFTRMQKPLSTRMFLHHFQNAHGLKARAFRTSKIGSTQRMLCLYKPYPLVEVSKWLLPRHLSISSIHLRLFVAGCGSW